MSKKKVEKQEERLEVFRCSYMDILPIDSLIPHPKNTNKHPPEQIDHLAYLMKHNGQIHPIKVSTLSGCIVIGHGRVEALKKLGWKEVAVDYLDFKDEADEFATMTSDNAVALQSEIDMALVNQYTLDMGPFDTKLLGFENFVVDMSEKLDPKTDEDEVPEVKKAITKRGDIWLLGNHRVMCGDSTMIDDVEKLMNGEKFSLMITDLPYGVSYADKNEFLNAFDKGNRNQKEIKNDHINSEQLLEFATQIYTNMSLFCEKKNAYYAFMPQGGEQMMMMMALKESGFQVKHELIWVKNNHVLGRVDYAYKHEPICYGWSQNGTHEFYGDFQTSIFEFNKPNSSKLHPTMKPIELIEKLIENSSKKNEIVIDPTSGSGSTLIACEKTNRKCYGMELDEHYCDVIINRWQNYTGKDAVLDSTGQKYKELSK